MSGVYVEDILAPLVRYLRADPVLQQLHTIVPSGGYNPVLGPPNFTLDSGSLEPWEGPSSLWILEVHKKQGLPLLT